MSENVRKYNTTYQRVRRAGKRKRGECYNCTEPALEGITTCKNHTPKRVSFCIDCGKKARSSRRRRCDPHYKTYVNKKSNEASKRRHHERASKDLCRYCGKKAFTKTLCKRHRDYQDAKIRNLFDKRRKAGQCPRCGVSVTDGYVQCKEHRNRSR